MPFNIAPIFRLSSSSPRRDNLLSFIICVVSVASAWGGLTLFTTIFWSIFSTLEGDALPLGIYTVYLFLLLGSFGLALSVPLLAWIRWVEKRPWASLGLTKDKRARRFLGGVLLGCFVMGILAGLMMLFNVRTVEVGSIVRRPFATLGFAIVLFIGLFLQASAEELLFRGYLLPALCSRHHAAIGVGVSSLIFALLHLLSGEINFISLSTLILFGLITSIWTLYSGSIWEACGFHLAWNWAYGVIFGMSYQAPFAILRMNTVPNQPVWLNGNDVGIESSLMAPIVLSILTVAILAYIVRVGSKQFFAEEALSNR